MRISRLIFTQRFTRVGTMAGIAACLLAAGPSFALRGQDMTGDDSGAVAVYRFDEMAGSVAYDTSGVGDALNLTMSTDGNLPTQDGTQILTNAFFLNGHLLINPKPNGAEVGMPDQGYESAQVHRTFLTSAGSATKLNTCTSGFTIQAFLRPWFPFQGNDSGNLIVGLSNSAGSGAVVAPNFGLYQSGDAGSEAAVLRLRTGANRSTDITSIAGGFTSVREKENLGQLTEVIVTFEENRTATVYLNRVLRSVTVNAAPVFDANARLVIGNELVPLQAGPVITQQRNWSGEIHHLAIYCRGFSRAEVLGPAAPGQNRSAAVIPETNAPITRERRLARKFVERLTGIPVPIDHPDVVRVQSYLEGGDRVAAAKWVTGDLATGIAGHPDFLNNLVKQIALKMSTREETIRIPLNDFAASFIGVTRDERSAKDLLTEDFFYMANPRKAAVRANIFKDLLLSNNHYEDLDNGQWDVGKVLMRVPGPDAPAGSPAGQLIAIGIDGSTAPNPDPAGLLTSRTFMAAHAIAGTNRRMVEYTFRSFMCMPMAEMADTSASPARVGRDVDRFPGGDPSKFETSCKGCHSLMDGFRGAFARFDFAMTTFNGVAYNLIHHTEVSGTGPLGFEPDGGDKTVDENGVVYKMNHNEKVFESGYQITDESFVNNAVGTTNKALFGWRGSNARGGQGVRQFGIMIADSKRFSQCMAKRVYDAVCTPGSRTTLSNISPVIAQFADRFEQNGYKLRSLFQDVAAHPACITDDGF